MFPLYLIIVMTTVIELTSSEPLKSYSVHSIKKKEIVMTGNGDDPEWKNALELTDFVYPWDKETAPHTSFKALHNKDWLYCLYQVKDNDINIFIKTNDKFDVLYSDRVEIFFRKNDQMSPYYGLEIDPHARIYDYKADYQQHDFTPTWFWPAGELVVKASTSKNGYTVEMAISKKSLRQLELLKGKSMEAGLYRGNCTEITHDNSKFKWISWVRPDSPTPNFHIPSSFGVLELKD